LARRGLRGGSGGINGSGWSKEGYDAFDLRAASGTGEGDRRAGAGSEVTFGVTGVEFVITASTLSDFLTGDGRCGGGVDEELLILGCQRSRTALFLLGTGFFSEGVGEDLVDCCS
jgi:hypothetical protein